MLNPAVRNRKSFHSLDSHRLVLIPIAFLDKEQQWSVSDEYLEGLWDRLVDEGQHEVIFMEQEIVSAEEFGGYMKASHNFPVIGLLVSGDDNGGSVTPFHEPAFIAWMNTVGKNNALCHFLLFSTKTKYNKVQAGKDVLDYWFSFMRLDGLPLFEVLLGKTPSRLVSAIKFIKRLGFTVIGEIPKIYAGGGATISFLEREAFYGRKSTGSESEPDRTRGRADRKTAAAAGNSTIPAD